MSTATFPHPPALGRAATGINRKPPPFQYPEEIKADFLKTRDIVFQDGRRVTAAEVWDFMTIEAPKRFPNAFSQSTNFGGRLSQDVRLFSSLKRGYLSLTLKDRLAESRKKGVPIVLVQGGQSYEPYFAAGAIPLRPGVIIGWARGQQEGLNLRQNDVRGNDILEHGRRTITIEACNQIAAHAAVAEGIVDVDLIAPYLCLRCSDMAYLVETHRNKQKEHPLHLVDHPISRNNPEGGVDYVAEGLHKLVEQIDKLTGRKTTDEQLRAAIRQRNRSHQLSRKLVHLLWQADVLPLNGSDLRAASVQFDSAGDTTASFGVLEELYDEVTERIKNGVRGQGLSERPKRLFVSGSCVGANSAQVEDQGAVVVGHDDGWSQICVDVQEEGDPYKNLARSILSFPYELSTEARAKWTAEQVRQSRADGILFMYNWGCNYQTGVARMLADAVKKETGLPTLTLEVGELARSEGVEQTANRVESFIEML